MRTRPATKNLRVSSKQAHHMSKNHTACQCALDYQNCENEAAARSPASTRRSNQQRAKQSRAEGKAMVRFTQLAGRVRRVALLAHGAPAYGQTSTAVESAAEVPAEESVAFQVADPSEPNANTVNGSRMRR